MRNKFMNAHFWIMMVIAGVCVGQVHAQTAATVVNSVTTVQLDTSSFGTTTDLSGVDTSARPSRLSATESTATRPTRLGSGTSPEAEVATTDGTSQSAPTAEAAGEEAVYVVADCEAEDDAVMCTCEVSGFEVDCQAYYDCTMDDKDTATAEECAAESCSVLLVAVETTSEDKSGTTTTTTTGYTDASRKEFAQCYVALTGETSGSSTTTTTSGKDDRVQQDGSKNTDQRM